MGLCEKLPTNGSEEAKASLFAVFLFHQKGEMWFSVMIRLVILAGTESIKKYKQIISYGDA